MTSDFDAIRAEARRRQPPPPPSPAPPRVKPPRPDRDGFLTFRAFNHDPVGLLWFILGISVPVPLLAIGWRVRGLRIACFALAGLLAGRLLVHYALLLAGWLRFRGWRDRLPFAVEGWSEWVTGAHFRNCEWWHRLEVTVEQETAAIPADVLEALWTIFAREVDGLYYVPDLSDGREPWKADGATARGSGNCRVAGALQRLLSGRLAELARAHGGIRAVRIRLTSEPFLVSPPTQDTVGTAS